MKRFFTALCLAFLIIVPLSAQETPVETPASTESFDYFKTMKGDQFLRISLAPVFPLNFPDFPSLFVKDAHQLSTGGMGSIGYHYFLTDYLAVGTDVGFGFNVTIGSHVFNYVPILGTVTFQPSFKKFEFPVTLAVGFAWEAYRNYNYFPGLVVKPELGAHYRIAESWSVGVDFSYMFMPQFMALHPDSDGSTSNQNIFGHFAIIALSARYYF